MSRKTTLILAVLLCLGLAAIIVFGQPEGEKSDVPATFLEFARKEIRSLDIKNGAGEVHLERDAKDPDRWRVRSGMTPVRAASERVEDLLNDLSRMAPKNFWTRASIKAGERKAWGLEAPALKVTLGLEGRTLQASFGIRTAGNQNVYAEKDAGGDVYVVPVAAVEPLEAAKTVDLREKRPLGFASSEAKTLSVKRAGMPDFEAVKAPGGMTWEVKTPFQGPADPVAIEDLVGKTLNVEIAEFVADGAPDPDRYGFNAPRATISVRREGRDQPIVLRLGKDAPDGKAYFEEEGEPSVFTCGPELPKAVEALDPAAMRDRNLLRIGWSKLDSIEFAHPEKGWKVLRVLERWDLVKPERIPAESKEVEALLDEIRKAEVAKFLDGGDLKALGLATPSDAAARLVLEGAEEAGNRTLLLGKRDAEGKVPARLLPPKGVTTDPGPVLVDGKLLDLLERGWLAWRSREVLKFDLSEVRGLSHRTAATGEESFDRENQVWKARGGGKEPDPAALTAAVSHLLTLSCSSFEAKTKEGLEKWGLAAPPATGTITVRLRKDSEKEEHPKTLLLGGAPEGGGSHYAKFADDDLVFRLPDNFLNGPEVVPFFTIETSPWSKPAAEAPPPPPPPPPPPAPKDDAKDGKPK